MKFIGENLKEIRIESNIDLIEVSKDLNISINLLESIEKDDFPDYISDVYLVGHIRAYSKYLNLDQEKIIKNYKIQTLNSNLNNSLEISKPIEKFNLFFFQRSIALASFIFLIFGFYLLFIKNDKLDTQYAMTPDLPENLYLKLEEIEMQISLENKRKIELEKIKIKNINQYASSDKINSSSAIASLPNEDNLSKKNKDITLKFLNTTWVQLRDENDKIVLSKLMNNGDEYSYRLFDNFFLTAGNAGNIMILIDGVVKGKAGKAGEVVDSLIVDNNFTN